MRRIWMLILVLGALNVQAQKPDFYLGFDQILDNREYFGTYGKHQTIFGARINPGLRFAFDSVHSLRSGINYMFEYGADPLGIQPQIDLSYQYTGAHVQATFGAFPRREVVNYPLILLTDSLQYYRPNLEGASVAWLWSRGKMNGKLHAWVDWMGRATELVREGIMAGIDMRVNAGPLYGTAIITRYHLARTEADDDENIIRDDGAITAMLGVDLSERSRLDRLDLSTGYVSMHEWARDAPNIWFPGWYSQCELARGMFGLRGAYYLGEKSPLRYGDPLFSSGHYGRLDLFIDPFKNPHISSKIGWNLHFFPGEGLYHSQQLLITVSL